MDVAYLFRHSNFDDAEIRHSLRSVAENLTWVRKVWVFGDRPEFLSDDKSLIEHVPWQAVAWLRHVQAPVRNFFLQCFLVAQHPDVDSEFLLFCDDYILLDHVTEAVARRDRFLEDLSELTERGGGVWKQTLWRTHDWLRRLGYAGLNFETHTPMFLTKKRVFEAYRDLHDYVTEDRFFGMLGPTGILSHAYKQERFSLTQVSAENLSVGFHHRPAVYADIVEKSRDKLFLNFDDEAFSDDLRRFLAERFPEPCVYERGRPAIGSEVISRPVEADSEQVAAGSAVLNRTAHPLTLTLSPDAGERGPDRNALSCEPTNELPRDPLAEDVTQVFAGIYQTRGWGPGESVSGRGASVEQTRRLVRELQDLLAQLEIRSLLDIPCGDWNWMKLVNLAGIDYIGADIVEELIAANRQHERSGVRFARMDLLSDPLPQVDAIFTRDCLVHLSFEQIGAALRNIVQSGSRWLLTTTFPGRSENRDIPTGRWRPLNLELAPFHLPPPERYLFEACTEANGRWADKSLGLWRIESLVPPLPEMEVSEKTDSLFHFISEAAMVPVWTEVSTSERDVRLRARERRLPR
jgi:hypothetical protein